MSAGCQSLSDCSLSQDFESENGHVGQVAAKNNLHHCKEHIQHYNISKNCDGTLSVTFYIDFWIYGVFALCGRQKVHFLLQ